MSKQIRKMRHWCLNKSFQLKALIVLSGGLIFSNGGLCSAIENKTFEGMIDFSKKDISFSLNLQEQGEAKVSGKREGDTYDIKVMLRHLKFGKSDLSTDFYTGGVLIKAEDGKSQTAKGKASTQASLLNFKPLKEFSADYELTQDRLTIYSLSWANFELNGQITRQERGNSFTLGSFSNAYFDLFLTVREMDLKDLAGLLGISPEAAELSGKVSGQVRILGPSQAIKIEAKLIASEGRLATVKFKSAKINAEGLWPVLRFTDGSVINDVGGVVYSLEGKFNVRELSDFSSAEHHVTVYYANNAMRLQDWVIRREHDYKGEEMVEAEYDLEKNQALKMRIKDQEEIVGWEKSVKF